MMVLRHQLIMVCTAGFLFGTGCARMTGGSEANLRQTVAFASLEPLREPADRKTRTTIPPAAPAPELPVGLETVDTMTVLAVVTLRSEEGERKFVRDITRARDRVHVAYRHQGQEWLFLRNPLDRRRATGELTDHRNQTIFTCYESDLADAGVGSGWRDVMTLGFPLDALAFMKKTGKKVTRAGMEFEQMVRDNTVQVSGIPDEVWWNDTNLLPLVIVRSLPEGGTWRQELTRIEPGGDPRFLMSPAQRFQTYTQMDKTDWADSEPVENGTAIVSAQDSESHHHH